MKPRNMFSMDEVGQKQLLGKFIKDELSSFQLNIKATHTHKLKICIWDCQNQDESV